MTLASPLARFDPRGYPRSYQGTETAPRTSLSHCKPQGAENKTTVAVEALLDGEADAITPGGQRDLIFKSRQKGAGLMGGRGSCREVARSAQMGSERHYADQAARHARENVPTYFGDAGVPRGRAKEGASYARKYRPDQYRAHLWRQCRNRFAVLGGWPVR